MDRLIPLCLLGLGDQTPLSVAGSGAPEPAVLINLGDSSPWRAETGTDGIGL